MKIIVEIDLAKSPHVVLERGESLKLINCLMEETGGSRDLAETYRIIENYEEYHRYSRRKFEPYITPPKDHREVVMGRSVIHKLKLFKQDEQKLVEIIFDRRTDLELLKKCLYNIGYEEIEFKKQLF